MKKPIRIGIVDNHPGVRIAVRDLLANAQDIMVVGEGVNGLEAIQLADAQKPDVLLLDVELPILKGSDVVRRIHENEPEIKVLALSSYNDPMYILGMLENGAAGYITKDEAAHWLLVAVHSIMKDKVKWISPTVAKQISHIKIENKTFTGRELELLRFIVLERSDEEIARVMDMSQILLTRYIDLLMEKFEASSREELKAAARGVISTSMHDADTAE